AAGWAVANVEYRRGREAAAPAAAADVRCAIKWVVRHAADFGVDATRLVLAGESAGAHLVMLAAFADSTAGLDAACEGPMPPVAGIVNWMGITDVNDLLSGANARGWATGWIGHAVGAAERARRLSPLRWIRPGLPPVITVHGDRDATVPVDHARRLHAALDSARVANELVILPGADHGPLTPEATALARGAIMRFLAARAAPSRVQ
ncbi:MAG: alpha/beta hydrolase fold domain-containing protein, partial [Gemmatimonadaceae bacterium]